MESDDNTPHIDDDVEIVVSGEKGIAIGVAYFKDSQPQALVRYKAADGRAVEGWWNFDALRVLPPL
jgi:hypothetical protein